MNNAAFFVSDLFKKLRIVKFCVQWQIFMSETYGVLIKIIEFICVIKKFLWTQCMHVVEEILVRNMNEGLKINIPYVISAWNVTAC